MILRPGECVGPETKRERFFRGILISGPAEDRLRRRGKTLLSLFFLSLGCLSLCSLARETQPGNNQSLPPPNSNPLERTLQVSPRISPRETSTNDRRYEFPASVTSYIKLAGSIYKRASCRRE